MDKWVEPFTPDIEDFSPLYERVQGSARRRGFVECVSEHLIRAVTQRLVRSRLGLREARRLAWIDRSDGYPFVDAFAEALPAYESNRLEVLREITRK